MIKKSIIINFHGIGQAIRPLEPGEHNCWISMDLFIDILDYLCGKANVQLTFDDANVSDYDLALPALKARRLTASFFIVADRIGQPQYLSKWQIKLLLTEGMQIGSHGAQHRSWPKCRGHDLEEELLMARAILEDIVGAKVTDVACPFGAYNRRILGRLRSLCYRTVYTSDGGIAEADAWIRPRNTVLASHRLEDIRRIVEFKPNCVKRWCQGAKLLAKRWM